MDGGKAVVGLGLLGLTGALIYITTRKAEAAPPPPPPPPPEEVIDAELVSGYVFWGGLAEWERVHREGLNEWPADTDITFAWEIRNTGDTGAYFQVYIFESPEWLYLEPGDKRQDLEEFHTPPLPTPGYQYGYITILGRKISGERIGAVWTSDEIGITYV